VTLNGAYSRVVNYDSAHEHELTVETLPLLYALASVIKLYDDAASIIRAIAKAQRTRYGNGRIVARRIGAATYKCHYDFAALTRPATASGVVMLSMRWPPHFPQRKRKWISGTSPRPSSLIA
jgi:hypothetical protein